MDRSLTSARDDIEGPCAGQGQSDPPPCRPSVLLPVAATQTSCGRQFAEQVARLESRHPAKGSAGRATNGMLSKKRAMRPGSFPVSVQRISTPAAPERVDC